MSEGQWDKKAHSTLDKAKGLSATLQIPLPNYVHVDIDHYPLGAVIKRTRER